MLTEKVMEEAICEHPEKFLAEKDLKLLSRQFRIGNYIFDLLFEDRHGAKLIVELQRGTLDRNHTYKILDYYHEYKEKNPHEFIELIVIANSIPKERRKRLQDWGISFREIPEEDFIGEYDYSYKENSKSKGTVINIQEPIIKPNTSVRHKFEKEKFQDAFDNSPTEIQDLFFDLLAGVSDLDVNKYPTNKPDFRLVKKNNFCEFVFRKRDRAIRIYLRVDSYKIHSDKFILEEVKEQDRPGKWVKFLIRSNENIKEAISLIKEVYNFSD